MAGAMRMLRPLRVMRLSTTAWIRHVAPVPIGPDVCVIGSMPANPLVAAAAIWPRALVARAIAVAAWSACEAAAAGSAELGPNCGPGAACWPAAIDARAPAHQGVLDGGHHAAGSRRHESRLDRIEKILVDLNSIERGLVQRCGDVSSCVVFETQVRAHSEQEDVA